MKIACDKCLIVESDGYLKEWLRVRTDCSEFRLCPVCADGFWMAVDNKRPPIAVAKEREDN